MLTNDSVFYIISIVVTQVRSEANGPVVSLVRMPPCHGGGQGLKSPSGRHLFLIVLTDEVAEIAQLVEHHLAKVGVASSSLVFRSLISMEIDYNLHGNFCYIEI